MLKSVISEDEIIKIHLENGLKNSNRTMNAFMIYRKNYALQNSYLSRNDASKMASESWKRESNDIKNYYRRMAENVKKRFKKRASLCFIHNNKLAGNNNNNNNKETNSPIINSHMDQTTSYNNSYNFPTPIYSSHRFVNTNQNSPNITYLYPLPMDQSFLGIAFPNSQNMNQNTSVTTYFNPFLLNMNQNPLDINYSDNRY